MLDDYSPLRDMTQEHLEADFHMFPIKNAWLYNPQDKLGGVRGSQGDSYFVAENPPFGAAFTYHLKESLKTTKQARQEREAKNKKDNKDNPYPGWDKLRDESLQDEPLLIFQIEDANGNVVDRMTSERQRGIEMGQLGFELCPVVGSYGWTTRRRKRTFCCSRHLFGYHLDTQQ